jgi:hypothetical protein
MRSLLTLLDFDDQEDSILLIALYHRGAWKYGRIDVLKAEVFHGESQLFPWRRLEPLEWRPRYAARRIHSDNEHSTVRICERRKNLRSFVANISIEGSFVFDAVALAEFRAKGTNLFKSDRPVWK